jgi:hypothetical protein
MEGDGFGRLKERNTVGLRGLKKRKTICFTVRKKIRQEEMQEGSHKENGSS